MASFYELLSDDEKIFLKTHKLIINRMIRAYGPGYVEEIITIRRITDDKKLMDGVRGYVVQVFEHIVQIIKNYTVGSGKQLYDVGRVRGTYTIFLWGSAKVGKYGGEGGFTQEIFSAMSDNNYAIVNMCELMEMIYTFRTSSEKKEFEHYIYEYEFLNRHYKNYFQHIANIFFGKPHDVMQKMNIYRPMFRMLYGNTCLVHKTMSFKTNLSNDCTSAIVNKNQAEYSILYREMTYEKPLCRDIYGIQPLGRFESIPNKGNAYYKDTIKNNKTYMAGYSGTAIMFIYIFLMFDIPISNKRQISYSIFALLDRFSPLHHSIHEVFSVISMLSFPEKTNGRLMHILKYGVGDLSDMDADIPVYNPSRPYSDTINNLRDMLN